MFVGSIQYIVSAEKKYNQIQYKRYHHHRPGSPDMQFCLIENVFLIIVKLRACTLYLLA